MRPLLVILSCLLPVAAFAAAPSVTASAGWAPPSPGQTNAVGYLTLTAAQDDALTGIDSDCCRAVELHTHRMDGDIMRMRRVDEVPLPAHETVTLEPGGYHIMLIGLSQPLVDGDTVALTLHFAHAPDQQVQLRVDQHRQEQRLQQPRTGMPMHHSH